MSKLLLVLFSIFVLFIAIFFLLIYEKKYSGAIKTKIFSPLKPSHKKLANNPDINTNNWHIHKNRLIKFGRSQYKGLTFFVSSDDKIYYISEEGIKVYC